MRTPSPLRYPGGKASMAGLLEHIRYLNGLGAQSVAEPFAGGAGASLSLLFREDTPEIYINDADPALHDFWWTLTNRPDPFLTLLAGIPITLDEWFRQRKIYKSCTRVSRLRRGFSAFYLNRCNRSGIIVTGGPIGGLAQQGKWCLDARFNRCDLLERCTRVAEYRDRIRASGDDGLLFIQRSDPEQTFLFIDPPYVRSGRNLYLNTLDLAYHEALASAMRKLRNSAWVITYDDCPEVRRMYSGWASLRPFRLRYSASQTRAGSEILITPQWLRLPKTQPSKALSW